MTDREIYFEFIVIGNTAKVTAIDALTKIEASIVGPAQSRRQDLERLALRRLERVLSGHRIPAETPSAPPSNGSGSRFA